MLSSRSGQFNQFNAQLRFADAKDCYTCFNDENVIFANIILQPGIKSNKAESTMNAIQPEEVLGKHYMIVIVCDPQL